MKTKYRVILGLLVLVAVACNDKTDHLVAANSITENHIDAVLSKDTIANRASTSYFLSLSDVHLNGEIYYTKFRRHHDTGNYLWEETKKNIEAVVKAKKPKFMVYLGDLPHHDNATRVENVTLMLEHLRALNINIPLLYLPGNNDSLGGDYASFQDWNQENPFSVDKNHSDPWPVLHDASGSAKISRMDFNKQFGFYATDLTVGTDTLKIIALNSVIFTDSYYMSQDGVSQEAAAQIQLSWLEQTLDGLNASTPILMMMHIPPGYDNYSQSHIMWNNTATVDLNIGKGLTFQNAFLELISKKKDQVKGILTSHTHFDGLRKLYNSKKATDSTLIAVSISTPGITIGHGNNPGFKLFEYENSSFDLLDFQTYYAKPTVSDSVFQFLGDSYTFKDRYKINDPNETIFESISKMDSTRIKTYMGSILAVESYKTHKIVEGYNFYDAMKVTKDQ